jgi:threonylcarbamoyladenosine tRNA methylthiotransferase MtaB
MVRRAVRTPGNPFVVVTGCYAQLEPEEVASIPGVDLVLGAREKFELFDHLGGLEKKIYPHVFVSDIDAVEEFGVSYTTDVGDRTRAFLKVQDGCDYNCSFCTIPLARGSSRSQSIIACVSQAREQVRQGFKEITLTGVNVGDYGKNNGSSLMGLLQALVCVEGLERLRVSSIEPNLLSDQIISFVSSERKMCKHFHVPLQSGSDGVLRNMRRRYTTVMYEQLIRRIIRAIPECGIGVDVIVGFPGETEEHFQTTCRFLESLPVSYLHVFTYSERSNTPAAKFAECVEPKVRFRRNEVLRALGMKKKQEFYKRQVGKTSLVLTESTLENGMRSGFTDNYVRVKLPAASAEPNTIVEVEMTGMMNEVCTGKVMRETTV